MVEPFGGAEVGEFFENNFDTAGNGDGNDSTNKAEHIHADNDGGENEGGREIEGVALELGGNEIVFYLDIKEIENNVNDGGDGRTKE